MQQGVTVSDERNEAPGDSAFGQRSLVTASDRWLVGGARCLLNDGRDVVTLQGLPPSRHPCRIGTMCPFCRLIAAGQFAIEAEHVVAFADAFPASRGHMLIVPRRHEADLFALEDDERAALWELVPDVKRYIERTSSPHGYNIGVNVGAAAGHTVAHAHLHVIPRYAGDVADPRGGVRWVIPA